MTGHATITRNGTWTFNPATGGMDAAVTAAVVYDGPCRVQALIADQNTAMAGQVVTTRDYLVQIDRDASAVHVDDLAVITHTGDPALTGARMHVAGVHLGTQRFTRDLRCSLDEG
jgi:hypothetical protein